MKSTQFYQYATWGLLLLNLILLGILFMGIPPGAVGNRAVDTLRLDKIQHEAFLTSAKKHEEIMKTLMVKQSALLKPYFQQLTNSNKEISNDPLFVAINVLEKQKIEATYEHFKEIKNILREDQMPDFEAFIDRMLGRILVEKEKVPPSPKEM